MQRKAMLGRKEMREEDMDEYKFEKGSDLSREGLEKAKPDFERWSVVDIVVDDVALPLWDNAFEIVVEVGGVGSGYRVVQLDTVVDIVSPKVVIRMQVNSLPSIVFGILVHVWLPKQTMENRPWAVKLDGGKTFDPSLVLKGTAS